MVCLAYLESMKTISPFALFLVLCALALTSSVASAQLEITIELDRSTYVLREPVRLLARYQNAGSEPLRIVSSGDLGSNMVFTYYEVTTPDGVTLRRKHQYLFLDYTSTAITGELLAPGDFVDIAMYPNLTGTLPQESVRRRGFTFPRPGAYRLRLAYDVPRAFSGVWRSGDGGPVLSNEVVFNVQPADSVETEILDAYWSASRSDLACGDGVMYLEIDETLTRSVLAKYPNHRLSQHLRLNLARGLISEQRRQHRRATRSVGGTVS